MKNKQSQSLAFKHYADANNAENVTAMLKDYLPTLIWLEYSRDCTKKTHTLYYCILDHTSPLRLSGRIYFGRGWW